MEAALEAAADAESSAVAQRNAKLPARMPARPSGIVADRKDRVMTVATHRLQHGVAFADFASVSALESFA